MRTASEVSTTISISPAGRSARVPNTHSSPPSASFITVHGNDSASTTTPPRATTSSTLPARTSRCTLCLTVTGSGTALIHTVCRGVGPTSLASPSSSSCRPSCRAPAQKRPSAAASTASMQRSLYVAIAMNPFLHRPRRQNRGRSTVGHDAVQHQQRVPRPQQEVVAGQDREHAQQQHGPRRTGHSRTTRKTARGWGAGCVARHALRANIAEQRLRREGVDLCHD